MIHIFSIFLAAITLALTAPAGATPPDAMDVSDELFGISETHLFVLRHTDDNLGQYTASARHVFLVAVDMETAEEEYWPVSFTRRSEFYDESGGSDGMQTRREYRPVETNPYDILGKRGGLPLSAAALRANPFPKAEITADDKTVKVAVEYGAPYAMPRADANARITASNRNLAARIWEPARLSRQYTTKQAWADRRVPTDTCAFSDAGRVWQSPDKPRVQLVRATCADEDETGVTSLILVLPAASKA